MPFFRKGWDGSALLVRPSKTHHSIWKIIFVLGADEYLERLELESAYSFMLKYSKITVCFKTILDWSKLVCTCSNCFGSEQKYIFINEFCQNRIGLECHNCANPVWRTVVPFWCWLLKTCLDEAMSFRFFRNSIKIIALQKTKTTIRWSPCDLNFWVVRCVTSLNSPQNDEFWLKMRVKERKCWQIF